MAWMRWSVALVVILPYLLNMIGGRLYFLVDVMHQHLAWQSLTSRLLVGLSEPPLWNPFASCGAPLLEDPQAQVLYPCSLLYRFLPLAEAYNANLAVHALIAASGTLALARACGLSKEAATLAGLSFGLRSAAILGASVPPVCFGLSWQPWVGAAAFSLARQLSVWRCTVLAVVVANLALAGSPQVLAYALVVSAICVLVAADAPHRLMRSASAGAACAGGVLLGAAASLSAAPVASGTGGRLRDSRRIPHEVRWRGAER